MSTHALCTDAPVLRVFCDDEPPQAEKKRAPLRLPKPLTTQQVEQLIQFAVDQIEREKRGRKRYGVCAQKVRAAERDLFTIQFGLETGLRIAEIRDIRIEEIDLHAQHLLVIRGKGDKQRMVPVPDGLVPIIRAWVGSRTSGTLITRDDGRPMSDMTMYWRVVRLGRRAGLPRRLHPHVMRHTYATRLYELTGDIRLVQECLGHESISTTQIYAKCAPSRMLAAVNLLNFGRSAGS